MAALYIIIWSGGIWGITITPMPWHGTNSPMGHGTSLIYLFKKYLLLISQKQTKILWCHNTSAAIIPAEQHTMHYDILKQWRRHSLEF